MTVTRSGCSWCASYIEGADLPDLGVWWTDSTDELIDFATGWTFVVEIGRKWQPAILTKSTGINGAAGVIVNDDIDNPASTPNIAIVWAVGELDTVPPGDWTLEITATDTGDLRERKTQGRLTITAQVLAEVP